MSSGAGAAGHSGIVVAAIFRVGIELTTPISLKSGTAMAGVAGPSAPPLGYEGTTSVNGILDIYSQWRASETRNRR